MKRIILIIILAIQLLTTSPVFAWDDNMVAKDRETLRDWDSVLELECFLALDDEPLLLIVGTDGSVKLGGNCEDYSFQLRNRAMEWSRILDTEIITGYEFNRMYRRTAGYNVIHMLNKAVIGNEVWLVEPQTDEIWLYAYLDD